MASYLQGSVLCISLPRFTHLANTPGLSQSILIADRAMCKLIDYLGKSVIAVVHEELFDKNIFQNDLMCSRSSKLQNLENHQLIKDK